MIFPSLFDRYLVDSDRLVGMLCVVGVCVSVCVCECECVYVGVCV